MYKVLTRDKRLLINYKFNLINILCTVVREFEVSIDKFVAHCVDIHLDVDKMKNL